MKKTDGTRPHQGKSDADLAADVRMVAQELSGLLGELKQRRIEWDTRHYDSGRIEVEIYRTNREDL
jgi:hypothetical protein